MKQHYFFYSFNCASAGGKVLNCNSVAITETSQIPSQESLKRLAATEARKTEGFEDCTESNIFIFVFPREISIEDAMQFFGADWVKRNFM